MRKTIAVIMILIMLVAAFLVAMPTTAAPATPEPKVTKRPVEDFLAAQTHLVFLNDPSTNRWAFVDFFGKYNEKYGDPFGTELWGSVTERVLADGRTYVHIIIHAKNTISWVWDRPYWMNPNLLFGNYPKNVVNSGVEPALTECLFELKFITPNEPGSELPDFRQLVYYPIEGQELLQNTMNVRATGPLHEAFGVPYGTPGAMKLTQKAILNTNFNGAVADGFPVENIDLKELPN